MIELIEELNEGVNENQGFHNYLNFEALVAVVKPCLQDAPKGDDILNYANFMSRRNPLGDMMFAEVRK